MLVELHLAPGVPTGMKGYIGHPCTRVFLGTRARITTAVETNPVQPARFESTPGNRDSRTEMVVQGNYHSTDCTWCNPDSA